MNFAAATVPLVAADASQEAAAAGAAAAISNSWLRAGELLHRAIGFTDGIPVIAGPGEIRIRKRNPTVGLVPEDIPRRRLAVQPEEEARLRIHVRMAPAIEDDSRDVSARVESARREHVAHLLAERPLVLREGSAEQFCASLGALLSYG